MTSRYFTCHHQDCGAVEGFHFPQLYGKECAVLVTLVVEGGFVIGKAFLECALEQPDVLLFIVIRQVRSYCCLVDDIRGQTVVVHWAIVLIHTVASSFNVGWLGYLFVVFVDDCFHVRHTTVAYFLLLGFLILVCIGTDGRIRISGVQQRSVGLLKRRFLRLMIDPTGVFELMQGSA